MKIFVGADHAGVELKNKLVGFLSSKNAFDFPVEIKDFGTHDTGSVDYPDFANLVSAELAKQSDAFGLLVCGSGQGMAMRANKFEQIRAAVVYNAEICKLSREHNDANIICLGSRFCTFEQAQEWLKLFLMTPFAGGRHASRVAKISGPI